MYTLMQHRLGRHRLEVVFLLIVGHVIRLVSRRGMMPLASAFFLLTRKGDVI